MVWAIDENKKGTTSGVGLIVIWYCCLCDMYEINLEKFVCNLVCYMKHDRRCFFKYEKATDENRIMNN